MTQNTSIILDWIPEFYSCSVNSSTSTGYQIAVPAGSVTATLVDGPPPNRVADDMLVLQLKIRPLTSVQKTSVTRLQTTADLLSQIASTFVAVLGGLAVFFRQYEKHFGHLYEPGGCCRAGRDEGGASVDMNRLHHGNSERGKAQHAVQTTTTLPADLKGEASEEAQANQHDGVPTMQAPVPAARAPPPKKRTSFVGLV